MSLMVWRPCPGGSDLKALPCRPWLGGLGLEALAWWPWPGGPGLEALAWRLGLEAETWKP